MTRNDDPPNDDDDRCHVCYRTSDDCVCKLCRTCWNIGDPECYHELATGKKRYRGDHPPIFMLTAEQWRSRLFWSAKWEADCRAEADWLAKFHAQEHIEP